VTDAPRTLLEINGVTKLYRTPHGQEVVALQDFNLMIPDKPARIVAVAGESGSGKSTLASLVLGFIKPTSGEIIFRDRSVERLTRGQRAIYRRHVQAVFQDPYGVFNPFYRIRHVFDLAIRNFKLARSRSEARNLVEEALSVVGLRSEEILDRYPYQLSGGQRQRVMMARAYLLHPDLIVADEPVSMIDASLRASILSIMERMRDTDGISFIYITHDLSTAHQISDEIYLLYQGATVEHGSTVDVLENPTHPYARALIASIPEIDRRWEGEITGLNEESQQAETGSGCCFYPRCEQRMDRCLSAQPALFSILSASEPHRSACYLYEREEDGER